MIKHIIKITTNNNVSCYYSNMEGDPGRTMSIHFAKLYDHEKLAELDRDKLSRKYPNREFIVKEVDIQISEISI